MAATRTPRVPPPIVFPSYAVRNVLGLLTNPSLLAAVLPSLRFRIPRNLRRILILLLLINFKSFPLMWHIRIFWPAIVARAKARPSVHPLLPFIPSSRYPTTRADVEPQLRADRLPLGRDLFDDVTILHMRATPEDCDWNGHLSNSSYAKALDQARVTHMSSRLLRMHFDGAAFALGGTSFSYHKEIPFMAPYDIEVSFYSWDRKWFYVLCRFVSPGPKQPSRARRLTQSRSAQNLAKLAREVTAPPSKSGSTEVAKKEPEPEAEPEPEKTRPAKPQTVYCTAISKCVVKAGRKTIPPWLIFATSGYGAWASTRSNWDQAESLRAEALAATRAAYLEKKGRPLPRDGIVMGGGMRRAGILANYDPARKERTESEGREEEHPGIAKPSFKTGSSAYEDDELVDDYTSGLGRWQDRYNWNLAEFEPRRHKNLQSLQSLVGIPA